MQSVQKHTLTPEWDEDLYVMVQEPKTQSLRVQMFDRDLLNVKACALHETCRCQLPPPPPPPGTLPELVQAATHRVWRWRRC